MPMPMPVSADHADGLGAAPAREADGSYAPMRQTESAPADTHADTPRSRRAFLRAAVVRSAAITGAGAAAVAPWQPQHFGRFQVALAAMSPTPRPTATPPHRSTATPTPTPPPAGIAIKGLTFNPATLSVSRGTIITWTNEDGFPHTSTSDTAGVWDSGPITGNGGSFRFTVHLAPGTYSYHCSIHPFMKGSITVV
jgi:plastocyanin